MKKINKRFTPYIFALIMAVGMSALMSFALTAINTGFTPGFFCRWGRAFAIGGAIAYPAALLISPLARKIVNALTE